MVTDNQGCREPGEDEDRKVSTGPGNVGTTGGVGCKSAWSGLSWRGAHTNVETVPLSCPPPTTASS